MCQESRPWSDGLVLDRSVWYGKIWGKIFSWLGVSKKNFITAEFGQVEVRETKGR